MQLMALTDPETVPHLLQQLADEGLSNVAIAERMGLRNSVQVGRYRDFEDPQEPTTPAILKALWALSSERGLSAENFGKMIEATYMAKARYRARQNLRAAGLVQV